MSEDSGTAPAAPPFSLSWVPHIADILQVRAFEIEQNATAISFVRLGGTSLRAARLAAIAASRLGYEIDLSRLLGPDPLAEVIAAAQPAGPALQPESATYPELRVLTARQSAMLCGAEAPGGAGFHLLFSAQIAGWVDVERLRASLACLTSRHEALRTVFVRVPGGGVRRRVLRSWRPELIEQSLPACRGLDPVESLHAMLGPAAAALLRPFERPPVIYVITRVDTDRCVLSVVIHQAIADRWSIGLLWQEFAEAYATGEIDAPAPSFERLVALETAEPVRLALDERQATLAGAPTVVQLPSDLTRPLAAARRAARVIIDLGEEAVVACDHLASAVGLTRNTVLLAAWTLVVARRAGVTELVMGVAAANRPDLAAMSVVGPCTTMLPVRCLISDTCTVHEYLNGISAAMRAALGAVCVPFEYLTDRLCLADQGNSRSRLVQVAFAACDELVPARLSTADLTLTLREGACGDTRFDAVLYAQKWTDGPRLVLEYGADLLRPDEATVLTGAIETTLIELSAGLGGSLDDIGTLTWAQRQSLLESGVGPAVDTSTDVWHLIEGCARRVPGSPAVRDTRAGQALTYRQLVRAVERQSSEFAAAGVKAGDCIGVTFRRSLREIVTVLAILRLGAAYLAMEPDLPEIVARQMLDAASSRIVLGDADRLARLGTALDGRQAVAVVDPLPSSTADALAPLAAKPDLARVAYVAFASGSAGTPRGTQVPHRAIVRLVREPTYLLPRSTERFLRLAPLGIDLSTLEIFAPLAAGGCVEVYPDSNLVPEDFAEFIKARRVTGMCLTPGMFRFFADYRLDAFDGVAQVLTGGGVVPAEQVRRVLQRCPGLRITYGYGPPENTTFTTVHHVDDPSEVDDLLPIGKPIPGTGLVVLGGNRRLVPPGGIGELYVCGEGLAISYVGLPEETAKAFGRFSPDLAARLYRTGDLVRWDTKGRLCLLGRRDKRVEIDGFTIELDGVARILRDHSKVRDAVVAATGPHEGDRRLLAGLVALGTGRQLIDEVRTFAAGRLPGYAVPVLWAVLDEFPVAVNGKLDVGRLEELALHVPAPTQSSEVHNASEPRLPDSLESAIAAAWREVLGTDGFGFGERFFDVGGESLQLLRIAALLRRSLPNYKITVQDLSTYLTINEFADQLRTQARA